MLKRDILFVPGGEFSVRDIDAVIHGLCKSEVYSAFHPSGVGK